MIQKILNKQAGMSYFQIAVLIFSMFAFSYLIYNNINDDNLIEKKKSEKSAEFNVIFNIIISVAKYIIRQSLSESIKTVSAEELGLVCCEKAKDGIFCKNAPPSECSTGSGLRIAPTECELTDFCEFGCCISDKIGSCSKNTPKNKCAMENGTFKPSLMCNVEDCRLGCCVIGEQTQWTTQGNCKFKTNAQNKDIPMEWRTDETSNSEIKCLYLSEKNKEGACLYDSGTEKKCVYTTLDDCISRTGSEGNFDKEGRYCSNPALNTTCKAKDYKGCVEGREDVFWFDSCGNYEDADDDCNLFGGTYCGKDLTGNYVCKNVDCVVDGKKRKNGEAWCEYDGAIGVEKSTPLSSGRPEKEVLAGGSYGRDTVGSRHVKHICYMGTERIEPCDDYRNQICVETQDNTKSSGSFSQASCRVNNWRLCMGYNSKHVDAMISKCNKNPDCFVKHVKMGGGFDFKVCLPAYPPGFNLGDENIEMNQLSVPNSGSGICSMATQRCTETWVCGIFGCFCVENCDCHTPKFTKEMNEFCISLGDCGAYVNYVGTFTDVGYSLKSSGGAPPRGVGPFSGNAGPQANQKPADPGTFEFFQTINAEQLADISEDKLNQKNENLTALEKELGQVVGAYGSPLLYEILSKDTGSVTDEDVKQVAGSANTATTSGYFNGVSSIKSSISAQITKKERKAGGFEMIGALIAGMIAYLITQSILITMIAAMLAYLFLMAWIIYIDIDFFCDMWERPAGGTDCNKCNKQDVPCSEYRCQSLGELCKFVNKGTPNELCISQPADESFPKIQPLESVLTPGYKYASVTENGYEVLNSTDGCVNPWTPIKIGIKVEPFAKCRFGYNRKESYKEMTTKFGLKGNSILPAHQFNLVLPSVDSIIGVYSQGAICNKSGVMKSCNITEELKELGTISLFVRCKTASGRENQETYNIKSCVSRGPDLTAPIIAPGTIPANKAFIKYGTEVQNVTIFVNEPAQCKWSKNDKDYDKMENNLNCDTNINHYITETVVEGMWGLPCSASFDGVKENSKYYIRCKDEKNNTMAESYLYELFVSQTPLIIDDLKVFGSDESEEGSNKEIISGVEPADVIFKISTSGGAENGKAICKWTLSENVWDQFKETNSSIHSYRWTQAFGGRYYMNFECEDAAGNIAQNLTSFRVIIDKKGPEIIRIYNEGGLKVITSEYARCVYSFKRAFDFDNATEMSGTELEHYADWKPLIYYIQCQDSFRNPGAKIMVRPYDVRGY